MGIHIHGASPSQCPECDHLMANLNRATVLYAALTALLIDSADSNNLITLSSALNRVQNSREEINYLRNQLRAHSGDSN